MERALELAERGRRLAHPNPRVGAVVVVGDEIVGRGFHRGPGTPHAEVVALDDAGARARGATLFVTLEPCCHHGRTPPCSAAIVAAGIARVVAAQQDPNPEVDGKGFAALRAAGVAVDLCSDALRARAEVLNRPFTRWIRDGLPFVTLKSAVTLDGKVAAAGGDARWISSAGSRRRVHEMRAAADAVMVGAGTVRRDDPLLTVRDAPGDDPLRVIVSSAADVPLDCALVRGASETPTLILARRVDQARAAALGERGVEIVETGDAGLDAGLRALARRGLLEILCEGGPGLGGALLAGGFVDRLCVFVAATVVGRGAPDLVAAPAVGEMRAAWRIEDPAWEIVDGDALVCGRPVAGGGEEA
jgi:diaminohydroxyphosphoribosylaminopyrimidine deaminase / 5-amino-6-(5-phosphoribosylamino)uracil reductase